jgi:hypothetical protein
MADVNTTEDGRRKAPAFTDQVLRNFAQAISNFRNDYCVYGALVPSNVRDSLPVNNYFALVAFITHNQALDQMFS